VRLRLENDLQALERIPRTAQLVDVICCEDCPVSGWRCNGYDDDEFICQLADIAANAGGLPAPRRCPLRLTPVVIYLEEGEK
jgi:hypothetical protein